MVGTVPFEFPESTSNTWFPSHTTTLASPSGRQYVQARARCPPQRLPELLSDELLLAEPGDMIEVLCMRGDWALGACLIRSPSSNCFIPGRRSPEGAFHLDWVRGIGIQMHGGVPMHAEVNPRHVQPSRHGSMLDRFREKRRQCLLSRVEQMWARHLGVEAPDPVYAMPAPHHWAAKSEETSLAAEVLAQLNSNRHLLVPSLQAELLLNSPPGLSPSRAPSMDQQALGKCEGLLPPASELASSPASSLISPTAK